MLGEGIARPNRGGLIVAPGYRERVAPPRIAEDAFLSPDFPKSGNELSGVNVGHRPEPMPARNTPTNSPGDDALRAGFDLFHSLGGPFS